MILRRMETEDTICELQREMEDDLKKICGGTLTRRDVVTDIINKYKGYYNRTNQNKNRLLQVYDQVKRSLS